MRGRGIGPLLRLAASVANFEDARALGRAYLAGQPEEADLTVLAELVAADLNLVPYGLDDVELHERFRGRVTRTSRMPTSSCCKAGFCLAPSSDCAVWPGWCSNRAKPH